MNVYEFIEQTIKIEEPIPGYKFQELRPRIICKDGFEISVQASCIHYCEPRENGLTKYDYVELGFPSESDNCILEYAEDPDKPTETVYGWVPIEVVNQLIEKHGGIESLKERA